MRRPQHDANEEFANLITHTGGTLFALVGAGFILAAVADHANLAMRISCWIYASALIAVYAASSLSHLFQSPTRRHFFRRLDQAIIFLFITASFTPFAIAYVSGKMLWGLLTAMWTISILGFSSKLFWGHRVESTAVLHYLALGWLPLMSMEQILQVLSKSGIVWSVAGGLCYTIGTLFLIFDNRFRYFHALWHLFVVAGSFCHFIVIYRYVIPASS